jgi:hypothetical protein
LVKDTEHRYQTAKDLRNELEDLKRELDSGEVVETTIAAAPPVGRKWFLTTMSVAIAALAVIAYMLTREAPGPQPIQGTFTQLTSQPGIEREPSLSPDGEFLVYESQASGNWDIYLQRVGGERSMNLTENSPADDWAPAFSPDGKEIAFRSERLGGGIFIMGATGENVRRLTDVGDSPHGRRMGLRLHVLRTTRIH